VKNESDKFASQNPPLNDPTAFNRKSFAGVQADYSFRSVNDPVVPTKGLGFVVNAQHMENLTQTDRSFNRYSALFGFYLPLFGKFSLAVRTGGTTVTGTPEFYQMASLGGGDNLRGFFRERFYGKTSFYDNNELRWIPNVRSYLFNGKIGLVAFLDKARIWQPGEVSDKWHTGYGGGFMIAPFNRLSATFYYGISEEANRIHVRLRTFL
jgi:outer membrane translocation and assembly module TamA